jgi:hypothetical protein
MTEIPDLRVWSLVWIVTAAFLLYHRWYRGHGAGLLLGYIVSFGALHWLASALYLLPWHRGRDFIVTSYGMRIAAIGMVAFAAGVECAAYVRARRAQNALAETPAAEPADEEFEEDDEPATVPARAVRFYLFAGAFLHLVLFPIARGLPSVTALVATGSTLVVTAVALRCWNAWQTYDSRAFWTWLAATALFPLFTVVTQGFLGYGLAAIMTILAFVAAFYKPRWHLIALGCVIGYVGLSVYVTYMRDRGEIRSVVWTGSALEDRLNRISETLGQWEWFDINDPLHRFRIDDRLNQNALVGASVLYVGAGRTEFAHGATLMDAVWSVVPRALWPDKPTSAGSGDLVSRFTGIRFAEGTSVGIGQVMELYVNFGLWSVIIGFFLIGATLFVVDETALHALADRDINRFALFYLPGLALLNIGGSFVESVSTAGAGLAVALVLNRFTSREEAPTHHAEDAPPYVTSRGGTQL